MVEIQGHFDVSLPIPIHVAADLLGTDLAPCQFEIDGDRVTMFPLRATETTVDRAGDYEGPEVAKIRVRIRKDIALVRGQSERPKLSPDQKRAFESTLVEATRRLVTILKHKTGQWNLDTRHPIYAYSAAYSWGGQPLGTDWPTEQGAKHLPEYAHGTIVWNPRDLYGEVTPELWQEAIAAISRPVSVPFYDELLDDAKTFRSHIRYDAAALYAAIASELMLERACMNLLRNIEGLSVRQCQKKAGNLSGRKLVKLIRKMDTGLLAGQDEVSKLFNLRDKIAHGEVCTVTWRKANWAIDAAEALRSRLVNVLNSPVSEPASGG